MTRDEIIRLAEECYIPEFENNVSQADCILLFAESLIDAERKRIIQKNALEIERINALIDRDTALLRQVLEALETFQQISDFTPAQAVHAIAALRARLGEKT